MSTRSTDPIDLSAGIILMAVAALFAWGTTDLRIGTAVRMGPGYFPIILSGLLFLLGLIIALGALRRGPSEPLGPIAWRGLLFILPAPVFFGLTVRGLGFVPALFLTTLIAGQASLKMRLVPSLILALAVTVCSTLVFSYALQLPFRRFGPWLPF